MLVELDPKFEFLELILLCRFTGRTLIGRNSRKAEQWSDQIRHQTMVIWLRIILCYLQSGLSVFNICSTAHATPRGRSTSNHRWKSTRPGQKRHQQARFHMPCNMTMKSPRPRIIGYKSDQRVPISLYP